MEVPPPFAEPGSLPAPAVAAGQVPAEFPGAVGPDEAETGDHTDEVLVHLFQWNWNSIAAECAEYLGPNGYSGVQVAPPQEHVVVPESEEDDRGQVGEYPWWQDYQPVSYQLDNTRRGDADDFQNMVDTCAEHDVKIYVDAVINHMTGPGDGVGSNGTEWEQYSYPDLFGDGTASFDYDDFGPCWREIEDWNDRDEVQDCELLELADLNTADPDVRAPVIDYLAGLVNMGVSGFRVDAAKHIQEEHLEAMIDALPAVPDGYPGAGEQPDFFHEVYGDATIPYTAYTPYGDVTNFDHQANVAQSFREGQIADLGDVGTPGGLAANEATVFVDNHDIQRDGHSDGKELLTYHDGERHYLATAYLLAHDYGTPKVMSSYDFELDGGEAEGPPNHEPQDGNPAGALTADTDCDSEDWICEHRAPMVTGLVTFSNHVGAAPVTSATSAGDGRLAFDRGEVGLAAFNATGEAWEATLATNLDDGEYCDLAQGPLGADGSCAGDTVTVADGEVHAQIPADGALALATPCEGDQCAGSDPDPDPGSAELTATVETWYGQEVAMVGNHAELGNWDPHQGLHLDTDADTYPEWSVQVDVPEGTEWKLVKLDPDGTVTWEDEIDNRVWSGADTAVTWNQG
ncbi:carbohydrate-binding module family 20 domain-containing protein [Lipingzhangella sp. LS1_29]|uniref:Alpha-amylase n=1 Tax=Lipingzhangella rawalii TaxID=2055835 RepID=A0ABU2H3F3_9ACTN|nr:carbohydrate-binding module family 20 domain-containing protein [Lipingzhangella rawalii]MDS1269522.1 carbohydrate-binding module family 20 domain-containing protein [Lipingzhangella rawalii]